MEFLPATKASILGLAVSLSLLAVRSNAQYDPKAENPIPRLRGTLFLGGGGELPDDVRSSFVAMAGGAKARLLLIAPANTAKASLAAWQKQQVAECGTIAWKSLTHTASLNHISKATGIWILGGDSKRFGDIMRGSPAAQGLQALIDRQGVLGCNGPLVAVLGHSMVNKTRGLGLVPGSILETQFASAERRTGILAALSDQPQLVGIGIEAKTVMVLHQRFLDVLGTGSVYGCISKSKRRPLRIDKINRRESPSSQRRSARARSNRWQRNRSRESSFQPRRLADLIAWSRSAQARVATAFPAYKPQAPNVAKGSLIIVGGGGMPKGLMDRFIKLAGGLNAPLLYVPCEERETIRGEPRILKSWRSAGVTNVDWIHTKDRTKANQDEALLNKIRKAKGIWFGGGRQWNFVDSYQNTTAHKLMHEVLAKGGVIGGSSAGASIQGSYLARANPLGNMDSMAEGYEIGLGFLTGVAIDQHFSQRGRLPDMTALANTYPELLGIGLDEASAIVVQGKVATAFSRDGRKVHIYDRRKPVVEGQKDHLLLAHGQRFDLQARKVLPPTASQSAKPGKK